MIEFQFHFPVATRSGFPQCGVQTIRLNGAIVDHKYSGGNDTFFIRTEEDMSHYFSVFSDTAKELEAERQDNAMLRKMLEEYQVGLTQQREAIGGDLGTDTLFSLRTIRNALIDMGKAIGIHNPEMMSAAELAKHLRTFVVFHSSDIVDGPGKGFLYSHRQKLFALVYGTRTSKQGTSENVVEALTELERVRAAMAKHAPPPFLRVGSRTLALGDLFVHAERRKDHEEKANAFDEFMQLEKEIVELGRQRMERTKLQRGVMEGFKR